VVGVGYILVRGFCFVRMGISADIEHC